MSDKNKDGYDDADANKDGIVTSEEQAAYDESPDSNMLPALPVPQGQEGANYGTTSSDILWSNASNTGTGASAPILKNKTQVKKCLLN